MINVLFIVCALTILILVHPVYYKRGFSRVSRTNCEPMKTIARTTEEQFRRREWVSECVWVREERRERVSVREREDGARGYKWNENKAWKALVQFESLAVTQTAPCRLSARLYTRMLENIGNISISRALSPEVIRDSLVVYGNIYIYI